MGNCRPGGRGPMSGHCRREHHREEAGHDKPFLGWAASSQGRHRRGRRRQRTWAGADLHPIAPPQGHCHYAVDDTHVTPLPGGLWPLNYVKNPSVTMEVEASLYDPADLGANGR